jgi:hypothetical protein
MLKDGRLKGAKPGGPNSAWRIAGQTILDLMGIKPEGEDTNG